MRRSLSLRLVLGLALVALLPACVRKGDPMAPVRPDPPVLLGAEPSSVLVGTDAVVAISGDRFRSSTTWSVAAPGVTLKSATFVSETRSDLAISVAANAPAGPVTVTAANPSSEPASAALFEVVEPAGPKLLSASPAALVPGSTTTVTFSGENLEPGLSISGPAGTGVSWSGAEYLSPTSCRALASVDAGAAPGPRDVTVTNASGKKGTAAGIVSVASAADPAIFSLSPASGPQGTSGLAVQVRGTNFKPGATVLFSGSGVSARSVSFSSAARLDLVVDIASSAAIASYDVTVTNPDNKVASARRAFAVTAPAVKLSTQVQAIFTGACAFGGCHAGGTPALGLDLSAGRSYGSLVGVVSQEVAPMLRVQAGNPNNSYLVKKVDGTASVGDRMPLGGPYLSAADIATIRTWIQQGAPNN